ncbi:von Willebrand factor A domain-containing protein 5B1 isoform X2 [Denticeps clupeoides]|uniref:von Willebrand factor A domain-containing protein 5B1 isoform X2 n=1 Tax=Denticeps clupeoides TaxID=299321 RepID=UPI0010A2FE3C|nr:von Willebrand factor A domain-containing protein 5B2 isoform X2 [Denticeps clupeoides]
MLHHHTIMNDEKFYPTPGCTRSNIWNQFRKVHFSRANMPGLRNRSTWAPLLLKSSCVKSCANGCSLGVSAHLTYANTDPESVEAVFVYPLGEKEVVVGFEAVIAGRIINVHIQSRGKLEDCCLDCGLNAHCGKDWCCCGNSSLDVQCANGHLVLDEDLERTVFFVGTGLIEPLEIVSVTINTSTELPTLDSGAIRIVFPTVLTPIVQSRMVPNKTENGSRSDDNGCFGSSPGKQERLPGSSQHCAHTVFTSPAANLSPYEFTFQLLVRGACLLAGLESPTHALRADADPSALSATATYITLAEEHTYDRHLEIILHLSEPHSPLVILEKGRLNFGQYEQQIIARRDFIRCARKDAEPEKKLEFVRKRYHKDILCNPVLMLNFCPDLQTDPPELQRASRELLFLIDRSSSMTVQNMNRIKEGMLVAIKSLPPAATVNIVSFASTIKTLFTCSKPCSNSTLAQACEFIQKIRADMGSTNLLSALAWVYQHPAHRSCPRQIFILTDSSDSGVGKVLELVRRNTCAARCFGLGLGPQACRRLLLGVARMTGGNTEFLDEEERLQPKLIKCLKKALEPALTDVRIDWYVPDNMEALLSPNEIPPLYPGNCLVGYCTLYNVSAFRSRKNEVKPRTYRGLSRGSVGSVFGHSQDELSAPSMCELLQPLVPPAEGEDMEEALREISREISSEFSCARASNTASNTGVELDSCSDVLRRIEQASYIQKQYVLTRCSLSSERGLPSSSPTSDSPAPALDTGSLPQGLERMALPDHRGFSCWDSPWQQIPVTDTVEVSNTKTGRVLDREESRIKQRALARCALSARSFSSPQGELDMHRLRRALEKVSFDQAIGGRLEESDNELQPSPRQGLSRRSLTDSNGLLFPASPLDWDSFADPESLFSAASAEQTQCRSLIHGLLGGRPVSWEVTVDLSPLWTPEEPQTAPETWTEIVHHLTARSVIRDYENMAEKESDIEHGPAKRHRMRAIQTSKSCNIVCMYTCFTASDSSANKGPVESTEQRSSGLRFRARHSSHSSSLKQKLHSVGLGRRPSSRDSEDLEDTITSADRDDTPASPSSLTSWDSSTGPSVHPASPSSSSTRSQRSVESRYVESFFGSRFNLGRLMSTTASGRQVPLKPHCLSAEAEKHSAVETPDYLPLVHLQLASGAFCLTESYSECIQIPLERLKRASPYTSHRSSLSPPFCSTSPPASSTNLRPSALSSPNDNPSPNCGQSPHRPSLRHRPQRPDHDTALSDPLSSEEGSHEQLGGGPQADSGRGSETDIFERSSLDAVEQSDEQLTQLDVEGSSWATAVALAWLEHRCAGFFVEWELIAAKADFWLRCQQLPEGLDLAGLKAAARQLFLLLRHWDENIQLNMLCYNPNNM